MAVASREELIQAVKTLMGASFDKVSDEGFNQACMNAEAELGWTYPISDARKSYWMVERAKRHVVYILMVESAHKFQYKQIHIEHRFKHYIQLIERMDQEFAQAIEDFPELFDEMLTSGLGVGVLGIYNGPGYIYDELGRDLTYLDRE